METYGKMEMNCEQVEAIVLDLDRDDSLSPLERAAAVAHVSHCPRCAALQESWQAAREELLSLSEETLDAVAPARVEMRLRQEFRTRHRTMTAKRGALVAAWALAAAALLAVAVSWRNWEQSRHLDVAKEHTAAHSVTLAASGQNQSPDKSLSGVFNGDDLGGFTPLPGALPDVTEEAEILRVRMQRGSLSALGLPVNEQRAGDWIQVDLLVGNDGLPQAVRLAQEEN